MSATQIRLDVPSLPIAVIPPNEFIPEKDKTPDWFAQYARWIVGTFYNQQRQPYFTGDLVDKGLAQEAIENWSYVNAEQPNSKFRYLTEDFNNNQVNAKWIPGGKIGTLIDHMRGVLLGSLDSIEVRAENLSANIVSEKADLYEKLKVRYELRDVLKQFPPDVQFDPLNDPEAELDSMDEIDEYMESWQDEYAIMAERIGESQVWSDDLKEKFLQSGTTQYVGGISAILTEVLNGHVMNEAIMDYESIWDNRNNDPWNGKGMVCGYVKHTVPYLEVINRFKDHLTDNQIQEIRGIAANNVSNLDQFLSFYNTNFGVGNRFYWWNNVGTNQMTVAYATVYFIAPRDYRYTKGNNRFGVERNFKINENGNYTNDNGDTIKGSDLNGDYSGWDLYTATLIGNKYVCAYGLANNVIRDWRTKKPLLPMRFFCNNMALNHGKSVVRKLIPHQDILDAYAFKIQEKVARDWGKSYIFNGSKMDEVPSTEIANDLKTIGVTVQKGVSGESDDPTNLQRMVEQVDMTLDQNIMAYISLRNEQNLEMEQITSVSRIALGQQQSTVGKGVQQNTINQNSFGTASLQWGLMKFFKNVLQYNVNVKQMLYQFKDSVEEALTIGDSASYLLRILSPKEFGTQQFNVFIDFNSPIDEQMRNELRTIALSEAQNGNLDTVDFIEHILSSKTLNQAVSGLKRSKNKMLKKQRAAQREQSQAAMQHEADVAHQLAVNQASQAQLIEDNKNWREELNIVQKNTELVLELLQNPPATSPLSTDLAMQNAQQEQAMAQAQEPQMQEQPTQ